MRAVFVGMTVMNDQRSIFKIVRMSPPLSCLPEGYVMPTVALSVLDWLDAHPGCTSSEKTHLLDQVPANQWAVQGGHWQQLSQHCQNRCEVPQEPRFMNRLAIYALQPLPRCLYRSPDGRGLAWLKSGGSVLSYGQCEQSHCERAKP